MSDRNVVAHLYFASYSFKQLRVVVLRRDCACTAWPSMWVAHGYKAAKQQG